MARFSKQYYELGFIDWYDFDLMDEFEKCPSGHCIPIICEGFGSVGIFNDKGACKLGLLDGANNKIDWKSLDEIKSEHKK